MPSTCWGSVRGEVLRVTKLSSCCEPVDQACAVLVTDGFISAVITQNTEVKPDVTIENGKGEVCVFDPGCEKLLDLTVVLTLCKINPELIGIMTGQAVVLRYDGVAVGNRRSSDLACDRRFALEIWTQVPNQPCAFSDAPKKAWGYFLLPCLHSATISSDITIDGANAITVEITAKTTIPSLWGNGPETGTSPLADYRVTVSDQYGTRSRILSPIGPKDHESMEIVYVAPPLAPSDCGCVDLDNQTPGPQVISIDPDPLNADGPNSPQFITIKGQGFTGTTRLTIGGVFIVPTVVDDGTITSINPGLPPGVYEVIVTTPGGAAKIDVTYVDAP